VSTQSGARRPEGDPTAGSLGGGLVILVIAAAAGSAVALFARRDDLFTYWDDVSRPVEGRSPAQYCISNDLI
jgi:hypothetical protein